MVLSIISLMIMSASLLQFCVIKQHASHVCMKDIKRVLPAGSVLKAIILYRWREIFYFALFSSTRSHMNNTVSICLVHRWSYFIKIQYKIWNRYFFFIRVFFHETWRFARQQRKEGDYLSFNFHPLTNIQTFICNFACEMTIIYF